MNFCIKQIVFIIFFLSGITKTFSQSVSITIDYNGAQANGCCTVCGNDYWCINNLGGCGTPAGCDTRTFFDPVPAGNIVTSITVNYWTADCYGNYITATIDGNPAPTVNEGNTGCLCSALPCGITATTSDTYPCGFSTYVYGGNNTLQLCTGVDVCVDRVDLIINYVPGATPGGPTYTWQGTISNDWNNPCNWDTKTVPNSTKDVIIPPGYTYYPIIYNGVAAYCNTIEVRSSTGAQIEIQTGGTLNITQ